MKVKFKHAKYMKGKVTLKCVGWYMDGSKAIEAQKGDDPSDTMTITTCLAGYGETPAEGNIFIKNYSENEGVLTDLVGAGVVETVREFKIPGAHAVFIEAKLLANLPAPGVDERGV